MRLGLLAGSSPVRVLPRHVPTDTTFSVLSHAALDVVEECGEHRWEVDVGDVPFDRGHDIDRQLLR